MSETEIDNGGPAFPVSAPSGGAKYVPLRDGMSLRDWFAGQALVGITQGSDCFWPGAARLAYLYADDMIAARKGDQS